MINLRYHIVSITAVFLALGLGVLLGSSFLGEAAVDQIDRNVSAAEDQVAATRTENNRLSDRLTQLEGRDETLADQAVDELFRFRLAEVPVLVIAAEGMDGDSLDQLERGLAGSAAEFAGTITLDDTLVVEDADQAGALNDLLGLDAERPRDVAGDVVNALAADLLAAADTVPGASDGESSTSSTSAPEGPSAPGSASTSTTGPEDAPAPEVDPAELLGEPETVQTLIDAGYLDYEPGTNFDPDLLLQSPGYRIVVGTGTGADRIDGAVVQPLLSAMVTEGPQPVVLAAAVSTGGTLSEVAEARSELIAPYIDGSRLGSRISTVDDLDAFPGVVATVLALEDLGSGRRGHYGVDDRASSMLPQAP